MTSMNNNSSQPHHTKFDTDYISIGIENWCSFTMSQIKQELVGPIRKWGIIIIELEGPKVQKFYERTIYWTINNDIGHTH